MSKLLMMAGSTATGDAGSPGWVSAYVVLSAGAQSRVFKVLGTADAPQVDEMDAATTLDLKRFQDEVKKDLSGMGVSRAADKDWVCGVVRAHLKSKEGIDAG
jgi:hypothetical protein